MIVRLLVLVCGFVGTALLPIGCHCSEEAKWSVCCVLYVRADQTASAEARAVIKWHRQSDYDGGLRDLAIAPETVESHVKNMFIKLKVETRAQAVSRAQILGLAGTRDSALKTPPQISLSQSPRSSNA